MPNHEEMAVPGAAVANRDAQIRQSRANAQTVGSAYKQAEQELAAAKKAYGEAWQRGDGLAVADAQAEIADAQMRLRTLRDGYDEIVPVAQQATFDETMRQLSPQLLPAEQEWIREHPDVILNPNMSRRLTVAYEDAVGEGLKRGSDEYFDFIENRVYGARNANRESNDRDTGGQVVDVGGEEPAVEPRYGSTRYAAPPSRSSNGDQPRLKSGQVHLSPAERDMAKFSNVTEAEYAKGKQMLAAYKKQGMYTNGY